MKTEINVTEFYSLSADYSKNRIYYIHLKAKWRNDAIFEQFRSDWIKAVDSMQKKFTVLADLKLMQPMPNKFQKIMEELQQYQLENGFLYSASVISADDIAVLQVQRTVNRTELSVKHFNTEQQAEDFLDEIAENSNQE
ncbi:hypothetical protein V9L05_19400 [Bernardetia sp. Wsw4-3y2]|uniref:hypothetical protein n=1 Tax=Bernardetia sp. Wsw4-3y2 TaxID=3127471 RepID=UPI0030CFFC7F